MPAKGILSQFCCLYQERLCGKGSACSPLGRKALTGPNWEGTRVPAACPGIGSWSEQATWCAKTYKWNRREHSCCSIHPIAGLGCCRASARIDRAHQIQRFFQTLAMCFDTSSSNTGHRAGTCILLEQKLERDLLYLACR